MSSTPTSSDSASSDAAPSSPWRAILIFAVFMAIVVFGVMWFLGGLDFDDGTGTIAEDADDAARNQALFGELREAADENEVPGLSAPGLDGIGSGRGNLRGAVHLFVAGKKSRPIPGVKVKVLGYRKGRPDLHRDVLTDDKGKFEFNDLPVFHNGLIRIYHPPYREYLLRGMSVLKDRTKDVGILRLGAPTSLRGLVVDARGRPVPEANVHMLVDKSRRDTINIQRAMVEFQRATSPMAKAGVAEDGTFLVGDLPPGRYVLRVGAPGFATTFRAGVTISPDEQSTHVRVVLDQGAGYEGYVRDARGDPLVGAKIIGVVLPGTKTTRVDRVATKTDGQGYYRLDSLIPGIRYFIEAWADGYAPGGVLLIPTSKVTKRDFKLKPSGSVSGRILDAATGDPVPGAQILMIAGQMSAMSPLSESTDEKGEFHFKHVSPGPILGLSVAANGYQQFDILDAKAVGGHKVEAGKDTWVEQALSPGGTVIGRVTNRDGGAVPYCTVALMDRSRRYHGELTAMSDVKGNYKIDGLRVATYELRVVAPGYAPPHTDDMARLVMPKSLGEIIHDLVLDRGAVVSGFVTNPDGEPQAGARVHLEAIRSSTEKRRVQDVQAVSGPAGAFALHGVPVQMPLNVVADHDAFASSERVRLELAPGAHREVDLKLKKGVVLQGVIVDEDGVHVEGARLRWGAINNPKDRSLRNSFRADELLGTRVVRSNDRGRFIVDGLREGPLLLKIEKEGFATWYRRDLNVVRSAAMPDLRVELSRTKTISGRVTSAATGRALGGCYVYAIERGPAKGQEADSGHVNVLVSGETGVDGRFQLDGVPPQRLDVVVWFAPGHIGAAQNQADPSNRKRNITAGAKNLMFALKPVGTTKGE